MTNTPKRQIWQEVAQDILVGSFWGPKFCARLIELANESGNGFKPLEQDVGANTAPGQEMRLNQIRDKYAASDNFVEKYKRDVQETLFPIIRKFWWPVKIEGLRMPFMIKYTMDTQRAMDAHHDSGLVSLVVKMNDAYTDGHLSFPRQGWDSRDVPVGHVILFPSMVTHVHKVEPITSGERYSFTGWIVGPIGGANTNYNDLI